MNTVSAGTAACCDPLPNNGSKAPHDDNFYPAGEFCSDWLPTPKCYLVMNNTFYPMIDTGRPSTVDSFRVVEDFAIDCKDFAMSMFDEQAGGKLVGGRVAALQLSLGTATSYNNGQFVWKIPEVARERNEAMKGTTIFLYSIPFHTSQFGYKMCLRLYMNGDGSGKGSHLSLFAIVMKGEYDALLPWPFNQMVTLMLLDQSGGKKHIVQCCTPAVPTASSSFWRSRSEMNVALECPKFALLSVLHDSKFVSDDTIFFKAIVTDH